MTPRFHVAIRNADGHLTIFHMQHPEITSLEQVMALVKEDVPDAKTVLIGIDGGKYINVGRQVING